MELSKNENIIVVWVVWHFYEMPKFLFSVWGNYLHFGSEYFSVPLLFATLLSPWRKYNWKYPKGFAPQEFASTLMSNLFSRLIGLVCRLGLIIAGIITEFFIFCAGAFILLLWILVPFIMAILAYIIAT